MPQQGSRTKKRKGEVKLIEPRQANKLLASKKSLVNSRDLASRFFRDTVFNMKEFGIHSNSSEKKWKSFKQGI